jgi:hypothetical protein
MSRLIRVNTQSGHNVQNTIPFSVNIELRVRLVLMLNLFQAKVPFGEIEGQQIA